MHKEEDVMHRALCHRCNAEMWTWSNKEDICERCGYEIRMEHRLAVEKSNQKRAPVSFGEGNPTGRVPVNVDRGKDVRSVNPYAETPDKSARINPMADAPVRKTSNPFGK